jgi:hypothetical protein
MSILCGIPSNEIDEFLLAGDLMPYRIARKNEMLSTDLILSISVEKSQAQKQASRYQPEITPLARL